ncbi:TPA: hypothetical protein EYP84_00830, partial [Candidatus Bipolaricaulota bacterium]|nr:hypothetical protein [Candidatus Bipolaricaulota bacterium]
VNAVAVTPDGRFAVSGSDDKTLCLWDLRPYYEQLLEVSLPEEYLLSRPGGM